MESRIEAPWKTYLKAVVFLLPPLVCYWMALVYVVPKLKEAFLLGGVSIIEAGWGRQVPFFLAGPGRWLLVLALLAVVLLEIFWRRGWARYRRATAGVLAWTLNVYVLLSLGCFFILALMAASGMTHPK